MKKFNLEGNIAKKICNLLTMEFQTCDALLGEIDKLSIDEYYYILEEVESINNVSCIFGFRERLVWKLQLPPENTNGIFWAIGPVKGFISEEEYSPGYFLSNIHLETPLNLGSD